MSERGVLPTSLGLLLLTGAQQGFDQVLVDGGHLEHWDTMNNEQKMAVLHLLGGCFYKMWTSTHLLLQHQIKDEHLSRRRERLRIIYDKKGIERMTPPEMRIYLNSTQNFITRAINSLQQSNQ